MPTKTIASNVSISAPFISPSVKLTGANNDGTVNVDITVPAGVYIEIHWEQSVDGVTWSAFNSNILDNSGGAAAITRQLVLTMPGVLNDNIRANVVTLTGATVSNPVVINSVTITN